MEPSSPLTPCFSWKSLWLVAKVRNDGYAKACATRIEDYTYQLLRLYSHVTRSLLERICHVGCELYCTCPLLLRCNRLLYSHIHMLGQIPPARSLPIVHSNSVSFVECWQHSLTCSYRLDVAVGRENRWTSREVCVVDSSQGSKERPWPTKRWPLVVSCGSPHHLYQAETTIVQACQSSLIQLVCWSSNSQLHVACGMWCGAHAQIWRLTC